MKRVLFFILGALFSTVASASNYPPSAFHQTVRLIHDGPALFTHVSTGIGWMAKDLIAYQSSGYLAAFNPDTLDAVITAKCTTVNGTSASKTTTVQLGREWHGTGYMSIPLDFSHHIPANCYHNGSAAITVAFSDGQGHWDSRFGQNYGYDRSEFNSLGSSDGRVLVLNTLRSYSAGSSGINGLAWDFILGELRKN